MEASFNKVDWAKKTLLYEVNIRQYTPEGTFKAFQQHVPRLKEMGVNTLWLMPITPISTQNKKGSLGSYYACSSYTQLNAEFGNESDFLDLIHCIHEHGMKVIIDWVANHTGRDHEWMQLHPAWFTRDREGNFTERNGWEDVVDLNYENLEMREALIGAMQYWISNFNIDGFRCDMAHLVPLDFWREARNCCDAIKPLFWLAECEVPSYHSVFDITYAWNWMHASQNVNRSSEGVNKVYEILHDYTKYESNALKLYFTSNHDENSWNGTEYERYGVAAKPWAVFTFTWKGVPLIYSGQELPNQKRLLFFDKDFIDWDQPPLLHQFYKILLGLKNTYPVLVDGATFILPTLSNKSMAYIRHHESQVVLIILNFSSEKLQVPLNHPLLSGPFKNCFSELTYTFQSELSFELLPGDYLVYAKG